ncbi:MAG: glycosyltransferase family 1 protein [Ignavibacteriota bacterium]
MSDSTKKTVISNQTANQISKRIRIAVNVRFLIPNRLEGLGNFTHECMRRIVKSHPEIDFYFLFDRPYAQEFIYGSNVIPVVLPPPARHPFLWFIWFEISVQKWLKKNQPELFLSPDGFGCLGTNVPQIPIMHDLAYEHIASDVPFLTRWYYRLFMPRFAREATRIASVSEFSKQDIVRLYKISPELIDVVYSGTKDGYGPVNMNVQIETRERHAEGCSFFLFVGIMHPRKNVPRLLEAFEKFKSISGSDHKLIITGRKAWTYKDITKTLSTMKHSKDVLIPGYLPLSELMPLVASAECMMYVSLFEGFGVPILEAMKSEVPVITSNVSSMPEIAGDAALLVNPRSIDDIAAAMLRITSDAKLRQSLVDKGRVRAQQFSWEATALKVWECCQRAL